MTTTAEALAHGWQLHQAGKWAAAEEIYRQVLQASPADPNAWCYLGIACHDQDRLDEAVAAYRRAIQLQPNFPIAFNNLGNTLRMQRRLDEAVTCFDQALRLKPDYVNAHKKQGNRVRLGRPSGGSHDLLRSGVGTRSRTTPRPTRIGASSCCSWDVLTKAGRNTPGAGKPRTCPGRRIRSRCGTVRRWTARRFS